jgi:hypothetical protein
VVAVSQDTVDVESERHVLSGSDLLLGHVLYLRGQEVTRDRGGIGHANRREARHTRGSGDGEGSAERVARTPTISHRGRQAQVVHELSGITDGASGGRNLDSVASLVGDGERARSTATGISGRTSTGRSGLDAKVSIIEARHGDSR